LGLPFNAAHLIAASSKKVDTIIRHLGGNHYPAFTGYHHPATGGYLKRHSGGTLGGNTHANNP